MCNLSEKLYTAWPVISALDSGFVLFRNGMGFVGIIVIIVDGYIITIYK